MTKITSIRYLLTLTLDHKFVKQLNLNPNGKGLIKKLIEYVLLLIIHSNQMVSSIAIRGRESYRVTEQYIFFGQTQTLLILPPNDL